MDKAFIDANIFLEIHLDDKRKESCARLLQKVAAGELEAFTSDFVVYAVIIQIERNARDVQAIKNFLYPLNSIKNLKIIRPSLKDMDMAISISGKYKLDFDDAFIVACMHSNEIQNLISFDKDFDRVKEIKRIEPR